MEAVRNLDYKVQYKVCEAFFQMMIEEGFGDDSERYLVFHDSYGKRPFFTSCVAPC